MKTRTTRNFGSFSNLIRDRCEDWRKDCRLAKTVIPHSWDSWLPVVWVPKCLVWSLMLKEGFSSFFCDCLDLIAKLFWPSSLSKFGHWRRGLNQCMRKQIVGWTSRNFEKHAGLGSVSTSGLQMFQWFQVPRAARFQRSMRCKTP